MAVFEDIDGISESLAEALELAKHYHQDATHSGEEYYKHPVRVVKRLLGIVSTRNVMMDSEKSWDFILIAAALHDTLEDTVISEEEISSKFGPTVLGLVKELTNEKNDLPFFERHRAQNEKMATVCTGARIIKICDRLDNLKRSAIGWEVWRRKRYARVTLDMLRLMALIPCMVIPIYCELVNLCEHILKEQYI